MITAQYLVGVGWGTVYGESSLIAMHGNAILEEDACEVTPGDSMDFPRSGSEQKVTQLPFILLFLMWVDEVKQNKTK